ncbi:MAG TPA: metalloregulator ArsR/SmtB family transcription factor [Candidatus Krumholzibacteria bacterium]|nr:metalloregulator ArsR/SmtB family transcription factor [Candidatus Krumholzibacteria bacterium]
MDAPSALAGLFKALADPSRLRLLRLLDGTELRVQELVEVLGLAQPTVSRHLGILYRAGLLRRRREGGWLFYGVDWNSGRLSQSGLGESVRKRLQDAILGPDELDRLDRCLEARAARSREFYARMAPQWEGLRAGLEIEGLQLRLLGGVLPRTLDIVDAGTGTGALLPALASAARQLIGVDQSPEMLSEARRRLEAAPVPGVRLLRADIGQLPLADDSVDAVCSTLALHHAARPAAVVAEFARVVRPGGAVVLSDLVEHDEEWMRSEFAHVWLGFAEDAVASWCRSGGLDRIASHRLNRRRSGAGRLLPDLFVLCARKPVDSRAAEPMFTSVEP